MPGHLTIVNNKLFAFVQRRNNEAAHDVKS
jgi:hypothetical protein